VRRKRIGDGGLDAFLHEYALSSQEGVALMCLAEALLRIPDAETVDKLIRDKIAPADWERHLGHSGSLCCGAIASDQARAISGPFYAALSRGRASRCGGKP
jgi:RHH-type proline utilization regulon transcriptional repressor/proline dehydrogenase/delta 1-pyrroline-5-carboxylate dehydrogenase